jgi:diacylglycerol kinase (ATP)
VSETIRSCVIYNPAAGRGRAQKLIESTKSKIDRDIILFPTDSPRHAIALTQQAIADGFQRIVAAGGDGTVHEVATGILHAGQSGIRLGVWPLGSMNDFAFSLGLLNWWNDPTRPLSAKWIDVGQATSAGKAMWFINCAGVGFNGMVTIESRKTRWLKGVPLYAWGLIKAMVRHFDKPVMAIEIQGRMMNEPTLAFSLCNGNREGGFPIGKFAKLDDGLFEIFHVGAVKRWELMRYLPQLITGNLPKDHPHLHEYQSDWATVSSQKSICCHLDGEFFCVPGDDVKAIDFRIHRNKLRVDCFE